MVAQYLWYFWVALLSIYILDKKKILIQLVFLIKLKATHPWNYIRTNKQKFHNPQKLALKFFYSFISHVNYDAEFGEKNFTHLDD